MANNNQQSREYKVLAHISAVPNGDKCGYSAYISLSPLKRKILSGRVSKGDAPAFAVYGELIAVRETVEFLAEAGINSATIKLNREKAIDALTGNAAVAGCETLAKEILGIIGDRDYVFSTEPESKTGTTYIMAKRALGQFDYKGGYKWRPECDGNVTDIVRFTVQEFYTRKTHEKWEYANLGYMCNSLNWGKATIGLPIAVKKTDRKSTRLNSSH